MDIYIQQKYDLIDLSNTKVVRTLGTISYNCIALRASIRPIKELNRPLPPIKVVTTESRNFLFKWLLMELKKLNLFKS